MIPKLLLAVLCTLCTLCNLCAQHATITGQIKNAAGNSITGATIVLYCFTDSLLIKTDITDSKGNYEINLVKADRYFISAGFTGHAKISTPIFTVADNEKITAPVLSLKIAEKKMQEVTVT